VFAAGLGGGVFFFGGLLFWARARAGTIKIIKSAERNCETTFLITFKLITTSCTGESPSTCRDLEFILTLEVRFSLKECLRAAAGGAVG
jgi:hypothetical protein